MSSPANCSASDSISALPASSQVVGSVTWGASLVAFVEAVAITSALSGVAVGAGVGVAVTAGVGTGSGSFGLREQPASIVAASTSGMMRRTIVIVSILFFLFLLCKEGTEETPTEDSKSGLRPEGVDRPVQG